MVGSIETVLSQYSKVLERLEALIASPEIKSSGSELQSSLKLVDRRIHMLRQTVSELELERMTIATTTTAIELCCATNIGIGLELSEEALIHIRTTLAALVQRNDQIKRTLQEQQ
jgi:hypothetical protein